MCCEGLSPAVPEGIHKILVVLDGNGAHSGIQVKSPPLEHDTILVVDASPFWEDEERCCVLSCHMRLHPLSNYFAVLHLSMRSRLSDALPECVELYSLRRTTPVSSRR